MDSIPTELLELQSRLDAWRAKRDHIRQQLPEDLKQAILELIDRYQPSLLRRVLNIDPWKLKRLQLSTGSIQAAARKSSQTAFFKLPQLAPPPPAASSSSQISDCRLELERPDGARLIFTLPGLDVSTINLLCSDFLRG
jgi:hypothetical protein